jgi:hypothetical protein
MFDFGDGRGGAIDEVSCSIAYTVIKFVKSVRMSCVARKQVQVGIKFKSEVSRARSHDGCGMA